MKTNKKKLIKLFSYQFQYILEFIMSIIFFLHNVFDLICNSQNFHQFITRGEDYSLRMAFRVSLKPEAGLQ